MDAKVFDMSMKRVTAIVLAAGEGKRMRSRRPKVLHPLCGRPLIGYALRLARSVADRIVVVIPPEADDMRAYVDATNTDGAPSAVTVVQTERLGTGHAVLQAKDACDDAGTIVVVPADMPLLSAETIERLLAHHARAAAAVTMLTARMERPQGYGRVLRQGGKVRGVVEDRDASDDQKKIDEVNTSVYCFDARRLWSALADVRADNDQGEYYLTDVIAIAARAGARIEAVTTDAREGLGVNDRVQLAAVTAIQRRAILERLMLDGVTVIDPGSTYVEDTVTVGPDAVLHPGVVLEGSTVVGAETVVGYGCHVRDCAVGERVELKPYCVLAESRVEDDAILGPFCHLRPKAHVGPRAKIGNFVELKKSKIGRGAKVPHLSYVGDATVGEAVNVGAGTITCNYDGVHKHETRIGDGAFIGTNTSLVAPVTIGEGAYIGAGSTITKDVPPGALAVARGHQVVKEGWAARKAKARPPHGKE
jgi:bifunctional UDP-N-acetylglucosamine pyrophosphorylase / glucosamine-1-phosphate N-acetyltransferase